MTRKWKVALSLLAGSSVAAAAVTAPLVTLRAETSPEAAPASPQPATLTVETKAYVAEKTTTMAEPDVKENKFIILTGVIIYAWIRGWRL